MKNEVLSKIEQWGKKTPDKVAIVANGKDITYRELIDSSKKLAVFFHDNNLDQTGLIGVFLSQCYELPICLLAIWMVGAAYVPLDPIYPQNRILDIISRVDLACLLTNNHYKTFFKAKPDIDLIDIADTASSNSNGKTISTGSYEEDLAYLIFTSGSSGKPKGVKVSPENLLNLLQTFERKLDICPEDRLLSITPISFDIFALELFLPLICGATCYFTDRSMVLDPDLLLTNLSKHNITIFQGTPSTYHLLIDETWPNLSLRHILCGGDVWDQKLALALLRKMPAECSLWNVYGPTETTIWSSLCKVIDEKSIFLSPSIDHTFFYVLDEDLIFIEEGELYIAGAGVANGYYKNDALTRDRFIENPFHPLFKKLYKTGDIIRCLSDGKFLFIGRKDQQVKIRGFRVELGDIEQNLLKNPSILRVAVIYDYLIYPDEKSLIACVQSKEENDQDYRKFLSNHLPFYMIPQHFIKFDHLPLTPNLKIDRQKLLEEIKNRLSYSQKKAEKNDQD